MSQSVAELPTTASPICVKDLTYFYLSKTALENVSFTLTEGSITALVGPNGAGKTTLMRNLAGLDSPYSGSIKIFDSTIDSDPRAAHMQIGYLSDDFGLYDELKVYDVLEFMGGCHGIKDKALAARIQEINQLLRLDSIIDKKCASLSRGWRQRVGIAIAIIHAPKILILDEPASGLDPEARAELSTVLKALQKTGMTILVSSHILAELEEYCTAMLVIRNGKIYEHVTLSSYQNNQKQFMNVELLENLTEQQRFILADHFGSTPFTVSDDMKHLQFQVSGDKSSHHSLLKDLMTRDFTVTGFSLEETSLQSLYLQIANKNS